MTHRNLIIALVSGIPASPYLLFLLIFWPIRLWFLGLVPESDVVGWRVKQFQSFLETGVMRIWLRLYGLSRGKEFPYQALDPGETQLPLLKLLSGSKWDSIECIIFQVSLDANGLQNEALSYTWGRPIYKNLFASMGKLSPLQQVWGVQFESQMD